MPNEILARKLLYRQAGEASPTPPYNHSYKKPALRYRMGRATAAPQVKQKKTTKCKRINEPNTLGEPAGRSKEPIGAISHSTGSQTAAHHQTGQKNIAITLLRICVEEKLR